MKDLLNKQLSLGEGTTPLIRLNNLEKFFKWSGEIWAKCEFQNPTGSFKDRGSIAEIIQAIKQNKNGVICASTGNMAASLSAYCAKAQLPCYVIIPNKTPQGKMQQARMYGAQITAIPGSYDDCVIKAEGIAEKNNLFLCGDYSTRRRGQESIGTELSQCINKFSAFLVPVGNGTLGCAISQGFSKNDEYPAFVGVQETGADPIFEAWKYGTPITQKNNATCAIASAMNVGNPLDGELTLSWIEKTNGQMISVTSTEILDAQNVLAQTEGIFVETAAAATVASLKKYSQINSQIVLILTGSGLKETMKGGEKNDNPGKTK